MIYYDVTKFIDNINRYILENFHKNSLFFIDIKDIDSLMNLLLKEVKIKLTNKNKTFIIEPIWLELYFYKVRYDEDKSNIKLNVIDGFTEAELNLKGAILNAPENAEYVVVYDLGGGSTEITLAQRYPELKILYSLSMPWGARNASEAFELSEYNQKGYEKKKKYRRYLFFA